jgi:hypothetical protein
MEVLDTCKALYEKLGKTEWRQLSSDDQEKLLELALRFAPGRHKMVALASDLQHGILRARTLLREKITLDFPDAFSFYRKSDDLFSQPILGNHFYGKVKSATSKIQDRINEQLVTLLIEQDLLETIIKIGL